jgi:hypothetical protein
MIDRKTLLEEVGRANLRHVNDTTELGVGKLTSDCLEAIQRLNAEFESLANAAGCFCLYFDVEVGTVIDRDGKSVVINEDAAKNLRRLSKWFESFMLDKAPGLTAFDAVIADKDRRVVGTLSKLVQAQQQKLEALEAFVKASVQAYRADRRGDDLPFIGMGFMEAAAEAGINLEGDG